MACRHKFESYLNLERLDFTPSTLIVGTFNPSWPESNKAEWFYGRTHDEKGNQNNNFWDVLPRVYGEKSLINLMPEDWKCFCKRNNIAITDLIISIEDANKSNPQHEKFISTYSDKAIATKFKKQTPVNIVDLLTSNPSIRNVYLTRGTGNGLWNKLWKPVVKYCNQNGITSNTLLTPSGWADVQRKIFNKKYPNNQIQSLPDFIKMRWLAVWHQV
jgi:hypothetical protein